MSQRKSFKFLIDTETTDETLKHLPKFLQRYYLKQNKNYRDFRNIKLQMLENHESLDYRVLVPKTNEYVDIHILAENPIKVTMLSSNTLIDKEYIDQLYEDLFLIVQLFEEEARKSTLYFAFMPNEKLIQEKTGQNFRIRLFTDSMLSLYVGLLAITFFLFWIFGPYAPIIFVVISYSLALFSGKILARSADWEINEKQPQITLLQYKLSPKEMEKFRKENRKKIPEIRREIFKSTLDSNKPLNCETAHSVFTKYGIDCKSESFAIKNINLFKIVKEVATKFKLSIPKIVVTNSIIPNAAAAGPDSKLGTIIITTGILTQLEENELKSVIGHEFSHLKSHDPIVMSTLSSAEFLLRFYVFLPYLFVLGLFSFWFYLFVALGLVYFFGKFLEGRADLDTAKVIGKPKVMAEALRKIGFRRLFPLYKREPQFKNYRILEWLKLDPHPPLYFRVERLDNMKEPEKIKNTFLKSIKDNFKALLKS